MADQRPRRPVCPGGDCHFRNSARRIYPERQGCTAQRQQHAGLFRPSRRHGRRAISTPSLRVRPERSQHRTSVSITTMKRFIFLLGLGTLLFAQGDTVKIEIGKHGEKSAIAVPDLRGAGDAQPLMNTFNNTLWNELQGSGQLKMVPKTTYPLQIPQQPADFRPPANGKSQGPWLSDWSGPPVNTNYLAFGYTATQNNQLVLYGWVYDVKQAAPSSAQLLAKVYVGSPDEAGSRKIAQEFAADILKLFGAASLLGTRIYFVSDRTGHKEIWSMNYDGSDQKQFTSYRTITNFPAISADGTKIAFTIYPMRPASPGHPATESQPRIYVHSLETGRKLP